MNLNNKRLEAFVIDVIVSFAAGIPFLLISILFSNSLTWMSFALAFMCALLLCKDVNNGRSFGKKNAGLCILSEKDEKVPSISTLILRNLFYILWPVEIILLISNSKKRLGDYVMRTKVVSCAKVSKSSLKITRIYIYSLIIVTVILFALFYVVTNLIYELSPIMRLLYS